VHPKYSGQGGDHAAGLASKEVFVEVHELKPLLLSARR
jgi:hypothetical protein